VGAGVAPIGRATQARAPIRRRSDFSESPDRALASSFTLACFVTLISHSEGAPAAGHSAINGGNRFHCFFDDGCKSSHSFSVPQPRTGLINERHWCSSSRKDWSAATTSLAAYLPNISVVSSGTRRVPAFQRTAVIRRLSAFRSDRM